MTAQKNIRLALKYALCPRRFDGDNCNYAAAAIWQHNLIKVRFLMRQYGIMCTSSHFVLMVEKSVEALPKRRHFSHSLWPNIFEIRAENEPFWLNICENQHLTEAQSWPPLSSVTFTKASIGYPVSSDFSRTGQSKCFKWTFARLKPSQSLPFLSPQQRQINRSSGLP
jgi:hypothetical protein